MTFILPFFVIINHYQDREEILPFFQNKVKKNSYHILFSLFFVFLRLIFNKN